MDSPTLGPHLTGPMKNPIVYTLVGGLVLFVWQFLSFAAINLHGEAQTYTEKDQQILEFLDSIDLEPGMYALGAPSDAERTDPALQEAYLERMEGQPWAQLNYQAAWSNDMTGNLLRSLVMNLLTAFLLFWMMKNLTDPTLVRRVMLAVFVGWAGFMFFPYSNFIWYKKPDIWAHLIDGTVPFALLGWLGPKQA